MTVEKPKRIASLFSLYRGRVGRFLRSRSIGITDIPDLTQEVFLRMLRSSDSEDIRNPEAYLFTIARNLTIEHQQKRAEQAQHLDITSLLVTSELIAQDDPAADAESQRSLEELERRLELLRPRVALTFVLHRICGYKIGEISDELGLAEITIKKYLAEALRELRQMRCGNSPDGDS